MTAKAELIVQYLDKLIPDPKPELKFNNHFELIVAVALSAQTPDKSVNKITPELFNKYPTAKEMKDANIKDLEEIFRPLGLYKNKAKSIKALSQELYDKFGGIVPSDREALESLPGVGRKTANVVLSNAFGIPAFAVDTHVIRVSNLLGISNKEDSVLKIEEKLMDLFPKETWLRLHHQFILFGRYYLTSRNPKEEGLKLVELCKQYA